MPTKYIKRVKVPKVNPNATAFSSYSIAPFMELTARENQILALMKAPKVTRPCHARTCLICGRVLVQASREEGARMVRPEINGTCGRCRG